MVSIYDRNIPDDLKQLQQWVCWIKKNRGDGKTTKIPKQAWSEANVATDKPDTWATELSSASGLMK